MKTALAVQLDIPEEENIRYLDKLEAKKVITSLGNSVSPTVGVHLGAISRRVDELTELNNGKLPEKITYDLNSSQMILQALCEEGSDINNMYEVSLYVLLNLLQDLREEFNGGRAEFSRLNSKKISSLMIFTLAYIKDETMESMRSKFENLGFTQAFIEKTLQEANIEAEKIKLRNKNPGRANI